MSLERQRDKLSTGNTRRILCRSGGTASGENDGHGAGGRNGKRRDGTSGGGRFRHRTAQSEQAAEDGENGGQLREIDGFGDTERVVHRSIGRVLLRRFDFSLRGNVGQSWSSTCLHTGEDQIIHQLTCHSKKNYLKFSPK